jgi:transposase
MLSVPHAVKVFLAVAPTDMRKNHDGLAALVEHVLEGDPLSGHLFVFRNRRADRVKLLCWDGDGYAVWYKRLENGMYRFPQAAEETTKLTVTSAELAMLLDGVDLASVRRGKRFRLPESVRAEATRSEATRSEATRSEATRSEVARSEVARSDAARTETAAS